MSTEKTHRNTDKCKKKKYSFSNCQMRVNTVFFTQPIYFHPGNLCADISETF